MQSAGRRRVSSVGELVKGLIAYKQVDSDLMLLPICSVAMLAPFTHTESVAR